MSSDKGTQSGTGAITQSGGENPGEVKVNRSPEELARDLMETAAEAKKYRQQKAKLAEEMEAIRRENEELKTARLKEQGQYKEIAESTQKKLEEAEAARKADRAKYAYERATSRMAAEAIKLGCQRPEDLIKLAAADGLIQELELSQEDFSVTPDSLKTVTEKAQKQYSYLFGKPTPGVRDGVPNTTTQTPPSQKNLATLKMDELIALAKTLPN